MQAINSNININSGQNPISFLFSNNFFLQFFITTSIGLFISNLNVLLKILINFIIIFCKNIIEKIFDKKYNSFITFTSISIESINGVANKSSENYQAIIYKMYKLGINLKRISEQNIDLSTYKYNINSESDNKNIFNYDINNTDEIIIIPELDIRLKSISYEKYNDKSGYNTKYQKINLYSSKLTVIELLDILNKWRIEYNDFLKQYINDGNLYYYSLNLDHNQPSPSKDPPLMIKNVISWDIHVFESFKTFDNIFFTDKKKLLEKLEFFINNEKWYKNRGIPYNFGLLFHGPPGCGKTSCIKAMANLTKRHVVEINLRKIKTCGEFFNVINNEFMNKNYVPANKKIILLEDIDCMFDIVIDREFKTEKNIHDNENLMKMNIDELFKMKILSMNDNEEKKYDNEDKLSLSCILNTIDGVLEQHGRILIITSNYPQKLDKALIRPGRIDLQINFTKCNDQIIKEIIYFFYETEIDAKITFPDDKYTPAEIINRCANTKNKMEDVINSLISMVE